MDLSSSAIKIENVWKVFGNTSKNALDAIQNQGISKSGISHEASFKKSPKKYEKAMKTLGF